MTCDKVFCLALFVYLFLWKLKHLSGAQHKVKLEIDQFIWYSLKTLEKHYLITDSEYIYIIVVWMLCIVKPRNM